MNQESIAHQLSPSLLKHILCHLFLVAFTTILVSCDLSASPTTLSSPLPTAALSSTVIALRQTSVAKATMLAQINQTETVARLTPQAKVLKSTPILPTEAAIPTAFAPIVGNGKVSSAGVGYIVVMPSPGIGSKYRILNQWYEDTNSGKRRIFVEVGAMNGPDGLPTTQGIVIVEVWQRSVTNNVVTTDLVEHTEYPTPIQAGPVKVVDAVGERLVLQSTTTGNTSYFDVPSRQFVPSLTWVSPISTPGAQPTKPSP